MSKGGYEQTFDPAQAAGQAAFADPTGSFQGGLDNFGQMTQFGQAGMLGALNPNAAYNAFQGQQGGLMNMAAGAYAPLTQQLNALAARQAEEGMQNAATQFNAMGAGRSGAANRAMGEAAANPFAQVAAQQQQNQLNLGGDLWRQGFGQQSQLQNLAAQLYGGLYGQGAQGFGNMAAQTGGVITPDYEYRPGTGEKLWGGFKDLASLGISTKTIFACLTPEAEITMADKTTKKVKDIVPGDFIIDGRNNKASVVGKIVYDETSPNGMFVEIVTTKGPVQICKMHKILGGQRVKDLKEEDVILGCKILSIKDIESPKQSYDLISSTDGSYQVNGLPVKCMINETFKELK